ncbi:MULTISPECIES: SH3 domain-containing protein [Thermaerobacter]|uniref:SH3 domain-containing protein n=1 Tax=Thermaerobacter subterraneus DSM 13965 TaxID=867903 RepID=K6PNB6_9FIRM|nr:MULTISPECIES: SH3 domain-containing protein [Thermaerobacter]EKP94382.1 SH3 domain-containing protein [Thermaerobacter subterraneus DSM 13965]QIA26464.1 SH3 domain-containing protein [Thermaerobacter sp. PB12/4term]
MSRIKELAAELREQERPLLDHYKQLVDAATKETERRLAQMMYNYQRFQLQSLELFQDRVPERFHCFGVVTHDDVNVRQRPSGKSEVLARVGRGTPVIVMAFEGFWAEVQLVGGETGYVFKDYVRCEAGG